MELKFSLEGSTFPRDYRKYIISYLKNALSQSDFKIFYQEYFEENKIKPYTFSAYLSKDGLVFKKKSIEIPNRKITVIFSTNDKKTDFIFTNAFIAQLYKPFNLGINKMTLTRIVHSAPKTIRSSSCIVRSISPIVVREHDRETNKNTYITINDSNFESMLNTYVKKQLKMIGFSDADIASFSVKPLHCKSTSALHYDSYVFGTIGTYELTGSPKILTRLVNAGMGSLSSCGFGTLDLIEERVDAS